MEYIKLAKAAEKSGISARRARILCAEQVAYADNRCYRKRNLSSNRRKRAFICQFVNYVSR